MTKDVWINLPVKDVSKSKVFFADLGFSFHPMPDNDEDAAALILGEKEIMVMLYEYNAFEMFTGMKKSDQDCECEVLFSITVNSREEVDEIAQKVSENGGNLFAPPQERGGWMYGCGFADLDGHRWNILCMNLKKKIMRSSK